MKVLVTGHRGYIGTKLVPTLKYYGHSVFGVDSDLFRGSTFCGEIEKIPEVIKDIRDLDLRDCEGFDAIIHLAGLSNDPLGDYDPALTAEINQDAAVQLAKIAKGAGVKRFVFASSCSNYGASGDDFLDEDAAFKPVTPYGHSKANVEKSLSKLADNSFSPTYLRASTAYGVSPRIRFDLVLNNLTAWAVTTGKIYLKSDGKPWRPLVHVEDIARAYVAILAAPIELIHDRAFNVGSTTENYQIRDIAEIVQDVVPNCNITFAPDAGPDKRCYRVDCNLIAKSLHDFKPQWTIRRGVEELYATFKDVGLTVEEFEGDKFNRIARLKKLITEGSVDNKLRWRDVTQPLAASHI